VTCTCWTRSCAARLWKRWLSLITMTRVETSRVSPGPASEMNTVEKDALSQPICRRRQHTMTPPAVHVGVIPAATHLAAPRHLQPVSGDHRGGHSLPTMSRHDLCQSHALICANQTLRPSSLRLRQLSWGKALRPCLHRGPRRPTPRHLRSARC
jgi:hypothetical protein